LPVVIPFNEEQARALINLEQRYGAWMETERALRALPYGMHKKTIGAYEYLYETRDRAGNARSLGAWSDEQAQRLAEYQAAKEHLQQRQRGARERLDESAALTRALRLPLLASEAGPILREADRRELLGSALLVVGTNAMAAYAVEAGGLFRDAPMETDDFDLAWTGEDPQADEQVVWDMLKAVDATFTVNTERTFQARNAKAYEVEILVAPSRAGTMARTDRPWPVPLPEQEWLLNGRPVDRVVACRDGSPARIVAPDPRWFALQKLWLADKPQRNALKRPKDRVQGALLLDAIAEAMPHYPLNADFEAQLPGELAGYYAAWDARRPAVMARTW
jgi:hypothetical protein